MRVLIAAGLMGVALASLTACGKPAATATSAGATTAPATAAQATAAQATTAQATTASAPTASTLIAADNMPRRKAGLWRQTMVLVGSDKTAPPTEACSDAISEAKLNLLGQQKTKGLCQNQQFTRNPDGSIRFNVSCAVSPYARSISSGTISGDFNASYKMTIDSKITGSPDARMNHERKMTITTTWIGPCAPGQRGGDLIMADGRKINLTDPVPGSR